MIRVLGSSVGLVACVPAPYELLRDRPLAAAGKPQRRSTRIPGWGEVQAKLRNYWSLLGFTRIPRTEIYALSMARRSRS